MSALDEGLVTPVGLEPEGAEPDATPALRRQFIAAARRPGVIVAFGWLVLVGVASVFAHQIAPYDPTAQDLSASFALPSSHHLLGADQLGRDILARLIYGGRGILLGCIETVAIALALGVPLGLLAGYIGKWIDTSLAFVVNILFSIPGFVLLIAIAFITNNNLWAIMGALGVLASATILRLVRSSAQAMSSRPFVDYARISGVRTPRILTRHVLLNVLGPLIVQMFFLFSLAFVISASLSFLSLGFNPETPSWGEMVYNATQNIYQHPWLMVPVGIVLTSTVIALQSLGTAFRSALPNATPRSVLVRGRGGGIVAVGAEPDPARVSPKAVSGADDSEILLAAEGLSVSFPYGGEDDAERYRVVDDVDLNVRRGETLGIVGESGSGKTMTALALLGLVPHPGLVTARSLRFDGVNVHTLGQSQQARLRGHGIGYVSQEPMIALDPCFTVGSTLSEPLRAVRGMGKKAAAAETLELLRLVGIARPDLVARNYPHQLSGGMAQRVAIALALACQPKLLIADEPTTALDVTIQAEILDLLRSLQAEIGTTVILVTHDLGVVSDMCSRVAVMYAAQIVEVGDTADLLSNPSHPYTLSLMGAVPGMTARGGRLSAVEGTVPSPQAWPVGCRFANRCPVAIPECRERPVPLLSDGERLRRCIREPSVGRAAIVVPELAQAES